MKSNNYCFTVIGYKFGDKRTAVRFVSAPDVSSAYDLLDDILKNVELWDSYFVYDSFKVHSKSNYLHSELNSHLSCL